MSSFTPVSSLLAVIRALSMGKTRVFLARRVLESPSLAPSSLFALAAPPLGFGACPAVLEMAWRGSCKCSPSPATLPKNFKPKSGMKGESSRLAVQHLGGFQRGLRPEAAMGQRCRSGGSAGMLELPVPLSPPPSYSRDRNEGHRRRWSWVATWLRDTPLAP